MYALTTAELMERPDLWRAVHKLRYEIFVEEMGWDALQRTDRLEIDQFDHDEAVHHLVIRNGELAGYQRMLPTTRPHLLTEVLQDLYVGTPPSGRNVWELTRYAVARRDFLEDRGRGRQFQAGAAIFLGDQDREIAGFSQRIDEGRGIGHFAVELAPVFTGKLGAKLGDGVADIGKFVLWLGGGHLNSAGVNRGRVAACGAVETLCRG